MSPPTRQISPQAIIAVIKINLQRRPLMSAAAAEGLLELNRFQLNTLVENGELPWAFDFSTGPDRKEIRLLTACVVERLSGPIPAIGATRNLDLPAVLSLVLPAKRESVRGAELQRWFSVSANWCADMRRSGEIKWIPEELPKTGPYASPRFTRNSVAKFLEERRIT